MSFNIDMFDLDNGLAFHVMYGTIYINAGINFMASGNILSINQCDAHTNYKERLESITKLQVTLDLLKPDGWSELSRTIKDVVGLPKPEYLDFGSGI